MAQLSTIKIPEKVYVGFQGRRTQDEVPLGFMTPYTDDQAGQKRRDTVDSWARGYGRDKTFNSVTLDNKPMVGFKIGRAIRRSGGWNGSGASYIRIEDPRGFELEISIENLVMCMSGGNIIEDGELMVECVWGRDGNRNILLPTNSEPYANSLATKAAVSSALSLRDVKVGDTIRLITGEEGVYLGGLYPLLSGRTDYSDRRRRVYVGDKKRYVMLIKSNNGTPTLHGWAAIKVAEIVKPAEKKLTPSEIHDLVLATMKENAAGAKNHSGHNYYSEQRGWVVSTDIESTVELEKKTEAEIRKINKGANYYESDWRDVIAEGPNNTMIHPEWRDNFIESRGRSGRHYYPNSRNGGLSYNYYSSQVNVTIPAFIGHEVTYGDNYVSVNDTTTHFDEKDLVALYLIKATATLSTGQVIEFYI